MTSGSGKTTFLENLITKKNGLFNIPIDRIIWCYAEESAKPNFEKIELKESLKQFKMKRMNQFFYYWMT